MRRSSSPPMEKGGLPSVGCATVNVAGSYVYEIDLMDAGEPGTSVACRILMAAILYDSGTHTLRAAISRWRSATSRAMG